MGRVRVPKKQYIAQDVDMIRSPAYLDLSGNAVKLLILMQCHWRMHEPIAYSVTEAQNRIGCCRGLAHKAFRELETHGFIRLVLEGHFHKQLARRWRLTYREFNDQKRTDEWQTWTPEN
jgi:hypothetical protein